jgi:hypothetical protein
MQGGVLVFMLCHSAPSSTGHTAHSPWCTQAVQRESAVHLQDVPTQPVLTASPVQDLAAYKTQLMALRQALRQGP